MGKTKTLYQSTNQWEFGTFIPAPPSNIVDFRGVHLDQRKQKEMDKHRFHQGMDMIPRCEPVAAGIYIYLQNWVINYWGFDVGQLIPAWFASGIYPHDILWDP